MKALFLMLSLSFSICGFAQIESFRLSEKHINKVNLKSDPQKKLKLYRKYFHRDSIKHERKLVRYWKHQSDSISKAFYAQFKKLDQLQHTPSQFTDSVQSNADSIFSAFKQKSKLDSLGFDVSKLTEGFPQSMQDKPGLPKDKLPGSLGDITNKPLENISLDRLKENDLLKKINSEVAQSNSSIGEYQSQAQDYLSKATDIKNSIGSEEKMEGYVTSRLSNVKEVKALQQGTQQVEQLKAMPEQYKAQMENLQDSAYLKAQAKKKAEELAMNYLSEHPEIMNGIQTKMSGLMKRYSVVPNSNDLSSAVKRTSLKGKSLREHLVVATNFQLLSISPVSIDFSPQVGYKFNRRFALGAGFTYRQTFGDSIPTLSPQVFGYKCFVSYDVLSNFFAYSEFDRNSPGFKQDADKKTRLWKSAFFLGVGRRFMIHPKVEMTLVFMYNFLHEPHDPIYPRPWSIRVGFQTSELAFFKGGK